jgi:cell division protein FtsB
MSRTVPREPAPAAPPESVERAAQGAPAAIAAGKSGTPARSATASLSDLPVAGLTRRRIALLIGALVAAWVIVLFARQVGDASEAASRADAVRAANVALQGRVTALEHELELIQRQAYIVQQARQYRLGTAREIPFAVADDAPSLAPDAPGMASVRLGAVSARRTPLEAWLDLLLGSSGSPSG